MLIGGFAATAVTLFVPVQRWLWYAADGKALLSAIPILPFVAVPLVVRPLQRLTRAAWILAAVMALDLVFFVITEFAPTGGHPSLETLLSLFLGMAKPLLVLTAIVLLSISFLRGERFVVVALGFVCLLAELLFAFYPIDAFLMNAR